MKNIHQQVIAMRRHWPGFETAGETRDEVTWIGSLAGIEREYRLLVEYGLPVAGKPLSMFRRFPVVRIMSPSLKPRLGTSDSPLPHVYFDDGDITLSPLCLFDPRENQWSADKLIALTTIPWAADWLACYEGWLATGEWFGGGRHAALEQEERIQ